MESTLAIGVIVASVREGRRCEAFGKWIRALLAERPNIRTEWIDLKEWPLPAYGSRDNPIGCRKELHARDARKALGGPDLSFGWICDRHAGV